MKIISALPFDRCESCKRCILSVQDNTNISGEKTVMVRCRNAEKCINNKMKGEKKE